MGSIQDTKLYNSVMNLICRVVMIVLIIVSIVSIVVPIYFNHWVGGWRIFFLIISFAIGLIVGLSVKEYYENDNRITIIVMILFLLLEYGLAGIIVHPWLPAYDIRSGTLQVHYGSGWDWPWSKVAVILPNLPEKIRVHSILFPGKALSSERLQWKLGYSAKKLKAIGVFVPFNLDEALIGPTAVDLQDRADDCAQKALILAGITEADLANPAKTKRETYLRIFGRELANHLPPFLEVKGEIKTKIVSLAED